MKRFLRKQLIATVLAIGIIVSSLFPGCAYAEEVGEQVAETSEAVYGEFIDKAPLIEQAIQDAITARGGDNTDEMLIAQVREEILTKLRNGELTLEEPTEPAEESIAEEKTTESKEDNIKQEEMVSNTLLLISDSAPDDTLGAISVENLTGVIRLTYEDGEKAKNAFDTFISIGYVTEYETSVELIEEKTEKTEELDKEEVNVDEVTVVEEEIAEIVEVENEKQVGVAIIDTGLDITSPVFANRLSRYTDASMTDENGHGTLMAEIIASQTSENVKILPIKAFDENGKSTVGSVYSAILYAVEHKADVINLSMCGAGTSTMLTKAIDYARSQNVTVVVSAGNNADNVESYMPGNIESAITVSATDENKTFAACSNYGKLVDFSAMGTIIKDMGTEDTSDDEVFFGTSIASAYVSAYVAHILDNNENADIEKCLEKSAEDLGDSGRDAYYGNGFLTLNSLVYNVNKDGSSLEDKEDVEKPTEADVEEGEFEMPLATARGEQIKTPGTGTVLAYRNIYEDVIKSTAASWQGWIDWYAGMGYTYTGYTDAKVIRDSRHAYWMWLTKGGKQYWCILFDRGAGNYSSIMKTWINVGDINGNNVAWYYIADNYLILNDGWLNCKISETNNNHSLRQAGWFYLNSSGQMQTGWHPDQSGKWYYFKMDETYHTDGAAIKVGESADGHGLVWEETTHETTYWSYLYHLKGVNIRTNLYLMNANGRYGANQPKTTFKTITPFVTSTYYYDANYVNSYLNTGCYNLAYIDKTQFSVRLDNGDYNSYYIPDFTVKLARKNYSVHATIDRGIASVSGEGTYYHGAKATLSATVKPGYEFVGWKNASGTVVSTNPTYKFTVTGITDLKTETKVIPYHIEIDYNGGTGENPTDYNVESEDITLNPPTKPGYEFIGWTGSNGDTPQVDVTIPQGTTGDLNYKANWRPNFKIFFDGNGSTSEGENYEILVEGDNFTLPENDRFAIDDHSFQGWSIHNDARYDSIDGFNGTQRAGNTIVPAEFLEYCLTNQPDSVEIIDGFYVIRMYAVWDKAPVIEAVDKCWYMSKIRDNTDEELISEILKTAKVKDKEDTMDVFEKASTSSLDVEITDFDRKILLNLGEVGYATVTCKATDGAGNSSTSIIKIYVTNANSKNKELDPTAGPLEKSYKTYVRLIDKENYNKTKEVDGKIVPDNENGALQEDSIWYSDEDYKNAITQAFSHLENETSIVSYEYDVYDITASKQFCRQYGSGNTKTKDGLKKWYQKFIVDDGAKVSGTLPTEM